MYLDIAVIQRLVILQEATKLFANDADINTFSRLVQVRSKISKTSSN